jgi:CelD/BcsL family acetyltransferase involved in cellulose biosynthesis
MSKTGSRLRSPTPEGAPSLSRSVRQDGDFDFESGISVFSRQQVQAYDRQAAAEGKDGVSRDNTRSPLEAELISDPQRLEELEPAWRALWSTLEDVTPFQSPDWILPWWHHYGQGRLLTFAFWSDHQLAGLAPLYIYDDSTDSTRRVFLVGTGNTDYLDVIIHPQFRRDCWQALVAEISQRRDLWDECNFQRLRRASTLLQHLVLDVGLVENSTEQEPCVVIDLCHGSPAEGMLKTSNVYARRLASNEPFSIEQSSPTSLNEFLSAFEQLHERRWRAKGLPGVLAEDRDRSFHREVAARFFQTGNLMFYALRIQGKLVSVVYGFHHRDRSYSYLSGFDPDYRRHSVGTILVGHAVQQALEQHRSFDFLKGQEPYKYRWGARDELVFSRSIRKAK